MPDRVTYPFSVWLQRNHEAVEEHDIQYSSDGRTVTCWLPEDLMQDANTVRWESNGLGHPCKIRILTERAHATTRLGQNGSRASIGFRPTASEPYIKHRTSTECSHLRRHTTMNYGHPEDSRVNRILTIKVEVLLPSQRVPPRYASGCLPIDGNRNQLCRGINKTGYLASRVRKRHISHPYRSSHRMISSAEPPSLNIPEHLAEQRPLSLTFYFRAQPRSMPCHFRLADCPQIYPYLKADYRTKIPPSSRSSAFHTPSQYQLQLVDRRALSAARFTEQCEGQSTRRDSNSVTSGGHMELEARTTASTKVVVSPCSASKTQQCSKLCTTTDTESSDSEIWKLSRNHTRPETRDVSVQTVSPLRLEYIGELEENRINSTRPRCRDCEMPSELDRLLIRMQQRMLEVHTMAASLRKLMRDSHQGLITSL